MTTLFKRLAGAFLVLVLLVGCGAEQTNPQTGYPVGYQPPNGQQPYGQPQPPYGQFGPPGPRYPQQPAPYYGPGRGGFVGWQGPFGGTGYVSW